MTHAGSRLICRVRMCASPPFSGKLAQNSGHATIGMPRGAFHSDQFIAVHRLASRARSRVSRAQHQWRGGSLLLQPSARKSGERAAAKPSAAATAWERATAARTVLAPQPDAAAIVAKE